MSILPADLADPVRYSIVIAAVAAALCWILQTLTTNYSWVDRLWSIMPPLYGWVFAATVHPFSPRLFLMAALMTLWGARLTYNFARKGGYSPKEEDYRWAQVRAYLKTHDPLNPLGREVFSLFFIAIYQHILIAFFCVPTLALVVAHGGHPLGVLDIVAALGWIFFLALESWTDEEQWKFQTVKHALSPEERRRRGGDFERGFLTEGPFRYSRHLNFFSEVSQWWFFGVFALAAGAPWMGAQWLGPFFLTLLFQGSTWITELISTQKYPEYRRYQKTTARLVPWFPGPPLEAAETEVAVNER